MKMAKGIVAAAMMLFGAQAFAIPTFSDLASQANSDGGNINISTFNHTALTNDALWNKLGGASVKFKAEISGYNNAMGYANTDGTGRTVVINEGAAPGSWTSISGAPDPFVFYLNTNQGNHWFSDTSLNVDSEDHMLAFQKKDGSNRFILFWDDQNTGGYSDRDFNDFVARVNFVSPVDVPEPGTLALLGLGLAALGFSRRQLKA